MSVARSSGEVAAPAPRRSRRPSLSRSVAGCTPSGRASVGRVDDEDLLQQRELVADLQDPLEEAGVLDDRRSRPRRGWPGTGSPRATTSCRCSTGVARRNWAAASNQWKSGRLRIISRMRWPGSSPLCRRPAAARATRSAYSDAVHSSHAPGVSPRMARSITRSGWAVDGLQEARWRGLAGHRTPGSPRPAPRSGWSSSSSLPACAASDPPFWPARVRLARGDRRPPDLTRRSSRPGTTSHRHRGCRSSPCRPPSSSTPSARRSAGATAG